VFPQVVCSCAKENGGEREEEKRDMSSSSDTAKRRTTPHPAPANMVGQIPVAPSVAGVKRERAGGNAGGVSPAVAHHAIPHVELQQQLQQQQQQQQQQQSPGPAAKRRRPDAGMVPPFRPGGDGPPAFAPAQQRQMLPEGLLDPNLPFMLSSNPTMMGSPGSMAPGFGATVVRRSASEAQSLPESRALAWRENVPAAASSAPPVLDGGGRGAGDGAGGGGAWDRGTVAGVAGGSPFDISPHMAQVFLTEIAELRRSNLNLRRGLQQLHAYVRTKPAPSAPPAKRRQRYYSFQDHGLGTSMWESTPDPKSGCRTVLVECNDEFERITGRSREDLMRGCCTGEMLFADGDVATLLATACRELPTPSAAPRLRARKQEPGSASAALASAAQQFPGAFEPVGEGLDQSLDREGEREGECALGASCQRAVPAEPMAAIIETPTGKKHVRVWITPTSDSADGTGTRRFLMNLAEPAPANRPAIQA
jgi:PAS domain-containing protein